MKPDAGWRETLRKSGAQNYRVVALVAALALTMEAMDATALIGALPAIGTDFDVPVTHLGALVTAYLLALAVFIPVSGQMADRFGARTVFCASILLFIVSSVACAVAPSITVMIVARFAQGMAGAMLNPIARLVVVRATPRHRLVSAMSWLILPTTLGPIVGPPLGGFLVTYAGWRWIFYLNIPIGIVALLSAYLLFDNDRSEQAGGFEWRGFMLTALSLSCLLFGLQFATQDGDGQIAASLLAAGILLAFVYVRYALRHPNPILDVRLLRLRIFRLSLGGGSLTRITQGARAYLLPLMFQIGFGMTAAGAGAMVLATAVGALVTKMVANPVLRRTGFRNALLVNGVIASGGYALAGFFRPGWPEWLMVLILFVSGLAMSFQFSSYNVLAYEDIPPDRMSSATSFYITFQQLLLSIGVSMGAVALHLSMIVGVRPTPGLHDFTVAFVIVCAISASATFVNWRFPRSAGATLGGKAEPETV